MKTKRGLLDSWAAVRFYRRKVILSRYSKLPLQRSQYSILIGGKYHNDFSNNILGIPHLHKFHL